MPFINAVDVVLFLFRIRHAGKDIVLVRQIYHALGENRLNAGEVKHVYHADPVVSAQLNIHIQCGSIRYILIFGIQKLHFAVMHESFEAVSNFRPVAVSYAVLDSVEVVEKLLIIGNKRIGMRKCIWVEVLRGRLLAENRHDERTVRECILTVNAGYLSVRDTAAYVGIRIR